MVGGCGTARCHLWWGHHGLAGPFSSGFGDPDFNRFLHTLEPGDLVFVAPNDPKSFVARMTGGPSS